MKPKVMLHPQRAPKLRSEAERVNANVAGFISWGRLVEALAASGEFRRGEEVEAFVLTDDGITYFFKR